MDIGEDYLNSALEELIMQGYAERTRERVKGIFQPYRYKIREFKKCSPDRENRPGSSGPENPVLQKKETETTSIKETTTQKAGGPADAAPLPKKKAEKKKPQIYPILDSVDIPVSQKNRLFLEFDEKTVINAIGWATHPSNPPRESLVQSIRFACNEGLSAALFDKKKQTARDLEMENKNYALEYDGNTAGLYFVECYSAHVEIYIGDPCRRFTLKYSEKAFKEQFKNTLRKLGFKILEE
ncbi:MAG: hypothetical protein ACHQ1H_04055 [Nitrososphaerales archaeon]